MKRISLVLLSIILCILSTEVSADSSDTSKNYLVEFSSSEFINLDRSLEEKILLRYKNLPGMLINLDDADIKLLRKNPGVLSIEEDSLMYSESFNFNTHNMVNQEVHQNFSLSYRGKGVKVGILDSGINYNHDDLKIIGGISFDGVNSDYLDNSGHGTHVAGIVGALDNDIGVEGVAPDSDLYSIKVLDEFGRGNYSNIVAGIDWAITNQIEVLNMSFGSNTNPTMLKKIIKKAFEHNIILVASAGNNGFSNKSTITYPAAYKEVIAVGAVDQAYERFPLSSVGKEIELMAPGVNILSTDINGSYILRSGTSMAAPYVTGVAAILKGINPKLDNIEIREILKNSTNGLGDQYEYGYGLIDIDKAIKFTEADFLKNKKWHVVLINS